MPRDTLTPLLSISLHRVRLMAYKELLQILLQGTREWNAWRQNHPEVIKPALPSMPLSGARLSRANLSFADLHFADLRRADLSGAIFYEANLSRAHFSRADLSFANLSGADLSFADLDEANLDGANLSGADLSFANLDGANLTSAILSGSILDRARVKHTNFDHSYSLDTMFIDLDLRWAEGLGTATHGGPSIISVGTIYLSEGKIPEDFLRGCGVPESLIVQIPALVAATQPIQLYSCFISYSSNDEELAQRLHADLQSKGVRCWFAPEDLKIGERFRRRIDEVIRVHDKLLLILSEHSVASSWVEKEVETAMESEDEQKRTILFPVRLDDSVMEVKAGWPADVRRTRHIGDFRRWKEHDEYQKAFARLLADLKASA